MLLSDAIEQYNNGKYSFSHSVTKYTFTRVVVDVQKPVSEFLSTIAPDAEYFATVNYGEIVNDIIEYIADKDTALGCLEEYALELQEIYSTVPEDTLLKFVNAVLRLGKTIFDLLVIFGLYNNKNVLPLVCESCDLNTLVLTSDSTIGVF